MSASPTQAPAAAPSTAPAAAPAANSSSPAANAGTGPHEGPIAAVSDYVSRAFGIICADSGSRQDPGVEETDNESQAETNR